MTAIACSTDPFYFPPPSVLTPPRTEYGPTAGASLARRALLPSCPLALLPSCPLARLPSCLLPFCPLALLERCDCQARQRRAGHRPTYSCTHHVPTLFLCPYSRSPVPRPQSPAPSSSTRHSTSDLFSQTRARLSPGRQHSSSVALTVRHHLRVRISQDQEACAYLHAVPRNLRIIDWGCPTLVCSTSSTCQSRYPPRDIITCTPTTSPSDHPLQIIDVNNTDWHSSKADSSGSPPALHRPRQQPSYRRRRLSATVVAEAAAIVFRSVTPLLSLFCFHLPTRYTAISLQHFWHAGTTPVVLVQPRQN